MLFYLIAHSYDIRTLIGKVTSPFFVPLRKFVVWGDKKESLKGFIKNDQSIEDIKKEDVINQDLNLGKIINKDETIND